MLERRSALAAHPDFNRGVRRGDIGTASVTIAERRPLAILQVSAFTATIDEAAEKLQATLGVPCPSPNRLRGDLSWRIGAIGPGIWQIAGRPDAVPAAAPLRESISGVATVVDLSHARTALVLGGPAAARVLAKHCSLDLDPRSFPAGSLASTRFAHLGITLAHTQSDDRTPAFELLVARGYAEFVFEALLEGAAEFGVEVTGAC